MCSCNSIIRGYLPVGLMKPMDVWAIICTLFEKPYKKAV
nr:MAG TPA: hypothetical protein [Inoviridae sp.]